MEWWSATVSRPAGPANPMSTPTDIADELDAELFARIRSGSEEAFAAFYDRHSRLLFSVALRILGDVHEAEDVLQESAVLLWEKAPVYDALFGRPLSWAVALTRNKSIDRLRLRRRKSDLHRAAEDSIPAEQIETLDALGDAVAGESARCVRTALAELPLDQRRAIELAFFSGMTQTEIAAAIGVPLGTIKARIRRGMLALRDVLEESL